MPADARQVLASVDIFSDFPPDFIDRCAAVAGLRSYPKGTTVVKEGEIATDFYVVVKGYLEVIRWDGTSEGLVAVLEPGRFFGEMALMDPGTRTATIRASEDAECLVLSKSDFDGELRRDPNAAAVFATRVSRRIAMIQQPPRIGPEGVGT
jgi:CRP-like cAMP-binding protein